MRSVIYWPFMLLFYITCLPICVIIALMDWNNGRGFRDNLREVMGVKAVSYTHLTLPTKA